MGMQGRAGQLAGLFDRPMSCCRPPACMSANLISELLQPPDCPVHKGRTAWCLRTSPFANMLQRGHAAWSIPPVILHG